MIFIFSKIFRFLVLKEKFDSETKLEKDTEFACFVSGKLHEIVRSMHAALFCVVFFWLCFVFCVRFVCAKFIRVHKCMRGSANCMCAYASACALACVCFYVCVFVRCVMCDV